MRSFALNSVPRNGFLKCPLWSLERLIVFIRQDVRCLVVRKRTQLGKAVEVSVRLQGHSGIPARAMQTASKKKEGRAARRPAWRRLDDTRGGEPMTACPPDLGCSLQFLLMRDPLKLW